MGAGSASWAPGGRTHDHPPRLDDEFLPASAALPRIGRSDGTETRRGAAGRTPPYRPDEKAAGGVELYLFPGTYHGSVTSGAPNGANAN